MHDHFAGASAMRVIPVMDIANGEVVHAIAGQREKYKPVKSILTKSSNPLSVAMVFLKLGFQELYIADLDAISLTGNNLGSIGRIATQTNMKIMVDAGFRRAEEVRKYVEKGVDKIVLATETLVSFGEIPKVINIFGVPVVASIDIKGGRVMTKSRSMLLPLTKLVKRFEDRGASEIIILNLDKVGTEVGPDYKSLKKALSCASIPILVGGGVRNITDIMSLYERGAAGVLVATALHTGVITRHELERLNNLKIFGP